MGIEDSALLRKFVNVGEKKAGSPKMGIIVGLFAALGGLLFGYDTGTISGVMGMDYVKKTFPSNGHSFSSTESSLIVSILSVGTFFGALFAPIPSDRIGRRSTLMIASVIFNIGTVLQVAATGIPLLCAGRVIAGFGVGMISAVIPLYQAESAPKWIRGAIVSCYQLAITIGILLAACINQGTHQINGTASYRIPIAIQFLWALNLGVGIFFLPETPRFYVSKDRGDDAKESLRRLRSLPVDHPEIIDEYEDIVAAHEFEAQFGQATWGLVFSNKNRQRRRLIMGTTLHALSQLSGINFIFYFGTSFFQSAGIKNPFTISLATNVVNVGSTIPGILLIEVLGRRKLLIGGSIIMCVSQFIVSIVGVAAGADSDSANKCLVAFTCIFIVGFAASWGPLGWAVVSETYALNVRQKSISLCLASNWLWNFAIAFATPYMVNPGKGNANLGSKVFFIWGGFNFIGGIFVYFLVFESKGLTLEQVDEMYEKVKHAYNSPSFIPTEHAFRHSAAGSAAASINSTGKGGVICEVEDASV